MQVFVEHMALAAHLLFFGLLALNLYFPIFRWEVASGFSWLFGWLASEFALHTIIFQYATLVLLLLISPTLQPLTVLILVFEVVVSAVFILHRHTLPKPDEFVSPLARESREPGLAKSPRNDQFLKRAKMNHLLRPHCFADFGTEVVKDVSFDRNGNKLDIYHSPGSHTGKRVFLFFHGGAWTEGQGSKDRQARPLLYYLASQGWICFSANYSLSPTHRLPAHLVDCKRALLWAKKNAREQGYSTQFVAVGGTSAGAHLATLLALTAGDNEILPEFRGYDCSVDACVGLSGIYDIVRDDIFRNRFIKRLLEESVVGRSIVEDPECYRLHSPVTHIHADVPPVLLVHGTNDCLVPIAMANSFSQMLAKHSDNGCTLLKLPYAQHYSEMASSPRGLFVAQAVHAFLERVASKGLA